jgi:glycosyltransferase involved in cell wall biosynthesis
MKVIIIHSELGVLQGGGENFTRNLFRAFADLGHDVSAVFIADSAGRYPLALPSAITPFPLAGYWSRKLGQETLSTVGSRMPQGTHLRDQWDRLQSAICWRTVRWHDWRFTRRVEREFGGRWRDFDAAYVHGSTVLASRVARYRPTVLRLPGPVSADFAPVLKTIPIVCANGDALSQIRRFLGHHVVELPVGLDNDVFRPGATSVRDRLGWTKNHWVIGYVGRLANIKGVDLLAEAFGQILPSIPHARLLIIGSGEEEKKLRARLDAELRTGIVHMESGVPHDLLVGWYRGMDLFVMPSRYENFSNAVLEALACEVPFLVSNIGGNRRLMETMGGWLFDANSVDSLVRSLEDISKHSSLGKDLGSMGRAKVCQQYSWRTSAQRLERMFQSCVKHEI